MLDRMLKLDRRARIEIHWRRNWELYLIALACAVILSLPFIPT